MSREVYKAAGTRGKKNTRTPEGRLRGELAGLARLQALEAYFRRLSRNFAYEELPRARPSGKTARLRFALFLLFCPAGRGRINACVML